MESGISHGEKWSLYKVNLQLENDFSGNSLTSSINNTLVLKTDVTYVVTHVALVIRLSVLQL